MAKIDANELFEKVKESALIAYSVYQEKGWKYFQNPVLICGGAALLIYFALGKPAAQGLNGKRAQIAAIRMLAQYTPSFNAYKSQLMSAEARFPPMKEKAEWLGSVISKACSAENVTPDRVSQPTESDSENMIQSSAAFDITLNIRTLGNILARIENNPQYVKITRVTIRKTERKDRLGLITATVEVSTIFPKNRISQQPAAPAQTGAAAAG
ncbi:MAG: hypothetical protein PHP45_05500 [Elusimicrobiales bacterium]|nr:hypothetical protein [Elusimicrobiales bacterium]